MRLLAACFVLAFSSAVTAQADCPNRPIRLVVTVPPGGAADFIARLVVEKLNREAARALTSPEVRDKLQGQGAEPMPGTPEAFASFMQEEMAKWAPLVKQAGVKLD